MKSRIFVPAAVSLLCSAVSVSASASEDHQHEHLEKITVTATPFKDAIAETMLPVNVLTGEELQRKVANSLGETLKNEPGIHSSSFGTGVGQPVIRGFSANRVQVVQDGIDVADAAAISPDHANAVEPLLADRIEVLRGPSTLLYGNGAIGGVVNIVDRRIPQSLTSEHVFIGEQSYDSVANENKTLVRFDGAIGSIGLHMDGVRRSGDNVEIPGFANMDPDAEENTFGFIENSSSESESLHIGASYIGERGFIGVSVGRIASNYGLPPGVHSHAHHDHDEHDDHDDDHDHDEHEEDHGDEEHHDDEHDEEHHEDEHGHGEDVAIRLDMEQTRYDLKAHYDFASGPFTMFDAQIGYTDYEHSELEIEEGVAEIGTVYANDGFDSRFTLAHAPIGNLSGVIGLQLSSNEFSAVGAEAYIDPADIDTAALFVVERLEGDRLDWEFGARVERLSIDPTGDCDSSETTASFSASSRYQVQDNTSLLVALSRSERAATVEERYSNITAGGCTRPADDEDLVLHAATDLLEVGNPDLDTETSNNIEIGLRHQVGSFLGTLNVFYNKIDSFIYLQEAGEIDEQVIAVYQGRDATFRGFEFSLESQIANVGFGSIDARLFGDVVRAEFAGGEYVPRIPPVRLGGELSLTGANASFGLSAVQAYDQNRVGMDEERTDGFLRVGAYADYSWNLAGGELTLFARGDNLLDEDIRNHTSLLKEAVPEPGRSVRLGLRMTF